VLVPANTFFATVAAVIHRDCPRDQGKASFSHNVHTHLGYNWRLSEIHAIIGLRHLRRLPTMLALRRRIAALYDDALAGGERVFPLAIPQESISS